MVGEDEASTVGLLLAAVGEDEASTVGLLLAAVGKDDGSSEGVSLPTTVGLRLNSIDL